MTEFSPTAIGRRVRLLLDSDHEPAAGGGGWSREAAVLAYSGRRLWGQPVHTLRFLDGEELRLPLLSAGTGGRSRRRETVILLPPTPLAGVSMRGGEGVPAQRQSRRRLGGGGGLAATVRLLQLWSEGPH